MVYKCLLEHDLSKLLFWCTVILFITEIMTPLILYELLSRQFFKTGCCLLNCKKILGYKLFISNDSCSFSGHSPFWLMKLQNIRLDQIYSTHIPVPCPLLYQPISLNQWCPISTLCYLPHLFFLNPDPCLWRGWPSSFSCHIHQRDQAVTRVTDKSRVLQIRTCASRATSSAKIRSVQSSGS